MHIGPASIAHPQSAGLEQPCEGAFNASTCELKLVAMFGTPPSQLRTNASWAQDTTVGLAVISAVRLHALRFSAWPPASTGDCGDTVHQGHELSRIMAVDGGSGLRSAAYRCRRRQDGACCPPCADQSGWGQFPPMYRSHRGTVGDHPEEIEPVGMAQFGQQDSMQLVNCIQRFCSSAAALGPFVGISSYDG